MLKAQSILGEDTDIIPEELKSIKADGHVALQPCMSDLEAEMSDIDCVIDTDSDHNFGLFFK